MRVRARVLLAGLGMAAILGPFASGAPAAEPVVTISITADAPGRAISPLIYGTAFATPEQLRDLGLPLNRAGGNSASLYNWREGARNAGADWYFESLPAGSAITDQFGAGFVEASRAGGAQAMLTMPLIGWVARLGPGRTPLPGFSVAKYGAQQKVDARWLPDAGNGLRPDGTRLTGNDPGDAARPITLAEQGEWVRALIARFGGAAAGGVRFYLMDNEPSLWHETHRLVHPAGAHASDIADRVIAMSARIRAADPAAQIVAPEEWGWGGYFSSGHDQQLAAAHGDPALSDRARETGGLDYLPWLLTRWKSAGHPVDVVSVHFYPQGGEYGGRDEISPETQRRRAASTRALWDRDYVDQSWIHAPVALIPRLRGWVDRYYRRGTPIAITEYNWGAEAHMSGAVAQADIWGIFGREGLDIATRWATPATGSPTYLAMKLVRRGAGQSGGFGDMSLPVSVPNADDIAVFAARRSADGALTLMVLNKRAQHPAHVALRLAGGRAAGIVSGARLANGRVAPLPPRRYASAVLTDTLPAQSITLFVLDGR